MEQLLANGLCRAAVYGLVAAGFGLIYRSARVFHIAHGAVCATAAYVAYGCFVVQGLSLFPTLLIASGAAAVTGVLVDLLVYRPLQERSAAPMVLLISSLGAYVAITNSLAWMFGNAPKTLVSDPEPPVKLASLVLGNAQLLQLAVLIPVGVAGALALSRTRLGRLLVATADEPLFVELLGYSVSAIRVMVFAVGSAVSGLATGLFVYDVGLEPTTGLSLVLFGIVAATVGGLHHPAGPLVGALMLATAQALSAQLVSSRWDAAVTYALLLLFLLRRPRGFLAPQVRAENE